MHTTPLRYRQVRATNVGAKQGGEGDEMRILHAPIMHICTMATILIYIILETDCANLHRLVRISSLVHFYTMPTPIEIYEALEARRVELGLSQADVGARAFGKPDNSAFQALRRGSSPSAEKLAALCSAVGWEFYFGPPREVGPIESVTVGGASFAQIPLHAASLSAGHGHQNHSEAVVDYLAFRRDWLRRIGVSPSSAVLARADGDSMQPTIWPGDLVLIDRTRADLPVRKTDVRSRRSAIFAFVEDGQARIKRVERPSEGELLLMSDNPDYGPQFARSDEISIIGKVMWWGHTNRE